MRKNLVIFAAILLMAVQLTGCGSNASTSNTIDGAALLQTRCTECHSLRAVKNSSFTQAEWQQIVDNMIERGAVISNDEKSVLIAYLADTYPAK